MKRIPKVITSFGPQKAGQEKDKGFLQIVVLHGRHIEQDGLLSRGHSNRIDSYKSSRSREGIGNCGEIHI